MSKASKVMAETHRWLVYARQDMRAAQALASQTQSFPQQICFLCQQSAEKKAVLIFLQIEFPFCHDLELLTTLIPEGWHCKQLTNLEQLTEWAVHSRYPTDAPDPSDRDAQIALQQAETVLAVVEQDMIHHGLPPLHRF